MRIILHSKLMYIFLISIVFYGGQVAYNYFRPEIKQKPFLPQITSFEEIAFTLDSLGQNSYVFLDVDHTLLAANDYIAHHFVTPLYFRVLAGLRYPQLILKKGYGNKIFSLMLAQAPRFLMEPSIIDRIHKLKKQGVHVLIITGMESGAYGVIDDMPTWRANMLVSLGIPLDEYFSDCVLPALSSQPGSNPVLHRGIICCNHLPKGQVIGSFLDHFNIQPDQIILCDDSRSELVSLKEEAARRNISVQCFRYRGAKQVHLADWSLMRSFKQLAHLIEHEQWMSDAEAAV